MRYFLNIFFIFVAKGYWVKQVTIQSTDLFIEYIHTLVPWLISVGGIIIGKDIKPNSDISEWDDGQLGVVVEFESKHAAQQAFESDIFQDYINEDRFVFDLKVSILG